MSAEVMTKKQLLQSFTAAYEQVIQAATEAEDRSAAYQVGAWRPREIVAHLVGWEVMAGVRIPKIVAGMPPAEFADVSQTKVMNNAINTALITLKGDQPLTVLCDMLRQAYQHTVALLSPLDDTFFQPGEYVYERTKDVIEHCHEHMEQLVANEV